jgi:dipeptidase E
MIQKKIIAIGGGDIRKKATASIDAEIIRLSGKKKPNLLFIPTASSDDEGYWNHIKSYFSGYWGCKVEVLFLIKEAPLLEAIKQKIFTADIIYVGGGNTLKMMRRWRHLGVDKLLIQAYNQGTVMCGVSAGSICWFTFGHSDSMSSYSPEDWEYIRVRGLGLIKGVNCPHYDSSTLTVHRKKDFQGMIQKFGGMGIAIDDNCAIEFIDGKFFKVLNSKPGAAAYKVYKQLGVVISEKIEQTKQLMPIQKIYERHLEISELQSLR